MATRLVDTVPCSGRLFDPDRLSWEWLPSDEPALTRAERRAVVERACADAGVSFEDWWVICRHPRPARSVRRGNKAA
jgi:hypothetical protein